MKERAPEFSDEERSAIAIHARALAETGEEAIWDLARIRLVFKQAFFITARDQKDFTVELGNETVVLTKEQAEHESDVMGEVIRQARVILQLEGRDEISILDRHMQKAGMGSLFDPESEAFKKVGHILLD